MSIDEKKQANWGTQTFSFWSKVGMLTVKYAKCQAWFLVVSWGFKILFS